MEIYLNNNYNGIAIFKNGICIYSCNYFNNADFLSMQNMNNAELENYVNGAEHWDGNDYIFKTIDDLYNANDFYCSWYQIYKRQL